MIDLENAMDELELHEMRLLWIQSDIANHVKGLVESLNLFHEKQAKFEKEILKLKNYIQ